MCVWTWCFFLVSTFMQSMNYSCDSIKMIYKELSHHIIHWHVRLPSSLTSATKPIDPYWIHYLLTLYIAHTYYIWSCKHCLFTHMHQFLWFALLSNALVLPMDTIFVPLSFSLSFSISYSNSFSLSFSISFSLRYAHAFYAHRSPSLSISVCRFCSHANQDFQPFDFLSSRRC